MSVIFDGTPGRLVAIKSHNPQAMALSIDLNGAQLHGVVTKLEVDQSVAAQFQASLDRAIYVVPFGDNIGTMLVSMILNSSCGDSGGDSERGTDQLIQYYAEKRLSPTNPLPGQLTIGKKTFLGYVTGFKLSAASESGYLFAGTLQFAAWLAQ
jgi:hypothetical protein